MEYFVVIIFFAAIAAIVMVKAGGKKTRRATPPPPQPTPPPRRPSHKAILATPPVRLKQQPTAHTVAPPRPVRSIWHPAAPEPSVPNRPIQWVGPGKRVRFDECVICDPLTYVTTSGRGQPEVDEPSLIDPTLKVANGGSQAVPGLPYWPHYSQMTPEQRSVYLAWMSAGRKQVPVELGYMFVFFYGLERRALIEKEDHALIFDEVMRLRQMYLAGQVDSWSFESYTTDFLWLLAMVYAKVIDEPRVQRLAESTTSWNEDTSSAFLVYFMQKEMPMPGWAAYLIAPQLPTSGRSVVIDRVSDEFKKLFLARYRERFGEGLVLQSSKVQRKYTHRTASAAIGTAAVAIPNPFGVISQFKKVSNLWNDCIEALRKLSSMARKDDKDGDEITIAKWEALPSELRATVDHPLTDAVCRIIGECTDDQGRAAIPVERLAAAAGIEPHARLTMSQSRDLCQTIENVGYCLEPDCRLYETSYKWDERVTAFLKTTDQQPRKLYLAAACMFRLGMSVAAADGNVAPGELSVILQEIERMFLLNEHEKRRLEALRALLSVTGPDIRGLSSLSQSLKKIERQVISKMLLALAAQDGVVTKDEIKAIKKCYFLLGFDQSEIEQALATLQASQKDDEPVTVRAGSAGAAGESIPGPKNEPVLRLNRAAIAQIMGETEQVAKMLAEAMSAGEAEEICKAPFTTPFVQPATVQPIATSQAAIGTTSASPAEPVTLPAAIPSIPDQSSRPMPPAKAAETTGIDPTIPKRYATFYQLLISRQEWESKELQAVARQQGLMLSGAIDALNEWAAEKFGGQLFVEDNEKIVVEQAYLN